MAEFDWPVRVYYEDTDSGGVVYHAQYLNFMERARTEWLRSLGFEQDVLIEQHQCIFAVHSMQIQFKRPARFNDALVIRNSLTSAMRASLVFEQKVYCDDELLCQAEAKVACLNANQFRPMPIPSFMLTELRGEC
jgi:acyl-CoA thioester hydrolase